MKKQCRKQILHSYHGFCFFEFLFSLEDTVLDYASLDTNQNNKKQGLSLSLCGRQHILSKSLHAQIFSEDFGMKEHGIVFRL